MNSDKWEEKNKVTNSSEKFLTFVNVNAINEQLTVFEAIAHVEKAELVENEGRIVFKATLAAMPGASKAQLGAYLLWFTGFGFYSMSAFNSPLGKFGNPHREHYLHLECWDSPTVFPDMTAADFALMVAQTEHSEFFDEDDPRMAEDSWKWRTPDEIQIKINFYELGEASFGARHFVGSKEYLETESNWHQTSVRFVKFEAYEKRLASQAEPF